MRLRAAHWIAQKAILRRSLESMHRAGAVPRQCVRPADGNARDAALLHRCSLTSGDARLRLAGRARQSTCPGPAATLLYSTEYFKQSREKRVTDFVARDSIVRRIWGDGDTVLVVFAGCAAEFALNRAVDWLFFTGRLPNDPIGRLFATAGYAQQIVFADGLTARAAFQRIKAVHGAVERQRGQVMPDWAHRDVLYMLIDYSEKAHELLARPLTADEQRELYDVFCRVGTGLSIPGLPRSYTGWRMDRDRHLRSDLQYSNGTKELYARYREHLGPWRYDLLLQLQAILVPDHVRALLGLTPAEWLRPLMRVYPLLARAGLRSLVRGLFVPARYLSAVRSLDLRGTNPGTTSPPVRLRHRSRYGASARPPLQSATQNTDSSL